MPIFDSQFQRVCFQDSDYEHCQSFSPSDYFLSRAVHSKFGISRHGS